ncbi:Coatomer/clathrin adaptor appendage, Ig-like subdomain [Pseudocohnilembus persalinus]|uniref:Coatomer subunit gamma n=1 Tax=Pseudocohnilembus persalinus TaxID=266149 RepID=A0A0V0QM43_PSEPJ|nr:Coatomer/clathrin adaptor appendage, Ig-like subdomain [Pseudocohnilembus persalinus]|eukprot:KRX03144.1 Coatomer/clathrin adaptor appendage, Ig-like subdomain [Pseudocohnilembus persalinus]
MSGTLSQIKSLIEQKIKEGGDRKKFQNTDDVLVHIQKSTVLQESKCFNDRQIKVDMCINLLSRLIYLINQGETFSETEGVNLFFSVTKLFQNENKSLRRMIYLMIKEFRLESSMYIVTASLIKDISSKSDLFRMNALRTIPFVLDQSNLVSVERLIKNALFDKQYAISSAALLAGIQLHQDNSEMVKKWQNEVIDKLASKFVNNHFHALILLHEIKKADKNSFTKILVNCLKENFKPLATIQLIRFVKEILQVQQVDEQTEQKMIDFLNRQSHKSNESIVFEACKALCELQHLSNSDLSGVVSVLSMFFQSLNNVNRFMALKIVNKLVSNPIRRTLIQNTQEIEALLANTNKSISSLAVSILLKLCQESNIEKLLGQIYENLADMSDDFKIDILRSIKSLIKSVPKRSKTVLQFLSNCLKAEGTYEFKKQAVDIIEIIVADIPSIKEIALNTLAEYIEDCQFPYLQLQVLSILNKEASKKQAPLKIIRFINNRIHLEDAEIRAAAIGIIGKFGQNYPELRPSMINLLQQTLEDPDEEVRERGNYHLQTLLQENQQEKQLISNLSNINLEQIDQIEKYIQNNYDSAQESTDDSLLDITNVEQYAAENKHLFKDKQQYEKIKQDDFYEEEVQTFPDEDEKQQQKIADSNEKFQQYFDLFKNSSIFAEYGPLRKMSDKINLTEDPDSENLVEVYKFFFDEHIVFEYHVKNNLNDRNLKNVKVEVKFDSENLQEQHSVPVDIIQAEESSNVLIGVARNPEEKIIPTQVQNILHFEVEELNPDGTVATSYEDEFQIDDFSISTNEYFTKAPLEKGKFNLKWEAHSGEVAKSSFLLHYQNTDFTVKEIIKLLGMSVCDGTDQVKVPNKPHLLLLSGTYLNTQQVLVQIMTAYDANKGGCPLKIQVKSDDYELSECITNCIQQ